MQTRFPELQAHTHALQAPLAAAADAHERSGLVAPAILQQLRERGLLNLVTPRQYGGQALPFTSVLETSRDLAGACMSTAWVATVGNVHNWVAASFSAPAQEEYFANQEVFSAASFAPTGQAAWVEGGLLANGRWSFLSGVDHAQWVFVSALVATPSEDPQAANRPDGPWFIMVPVSELQIDQQSWQVAGLCATGSKDVVLDNVFVPAHRCVFLPQLMQGQAPGRGLHDDPVFATPFQPALIAVLAAPILGAAKQAVVEFTQYTTGRVIKMTGGKQAEQAPVQITLAEVAATVDTAELIMGDIFARLDSGVMKSPADYTRIYRDTAFAGKLLIQTVNTIMHSAGGGALQKDNPVQRIWRDVNAAGNHAALSWPTQAQAWGAQQLQV